MTSIKFKSLSSGSCGNCYFVGIFDKESHCECGVLIDAGVSMRRVKRELLDSGIGLDSLRAILLTHDHMDHIRAIGSYCKYLQLPVWMHPELVRAMSGHFVAGKHLQAVRRRLCEGWNEIVPGRIRASWFTVPHDASHTVGYFLDIDGYGLTVMTDLGQVTEKALEMASQSSTVVIESNYDPEMLKNGPYPKILQDRISGSNGHLSNLDCASAVRKFARDGLENVFLCHLSEHNNTPALAYNATRGVLDEKVRVVTLPRTTPSQWFNLQMPKNC